MIQMQFEFKNKLWIYSGEGAWYFLTLPAEYTDELKQLRDPLAKGFGSLRVEARIDETTWKTSIFPDSKSDSYVLPVKKEVRRANNLEAGDTVECSVTILG